MASELKPCPFCGGTAKVRYLRSPWSGPTSQKKYFYVECQRCLVKTRPEGNEQRAKETWERRANDHP